MDLPAKREELNKVIEMAQFKKVVNRLDKGVNTNVMEKGKVIEQGSYNDLLGKKGQFYKLWNLQKNIK